MERAPHDAVLALNAGLSAAIGTRWAKTGTFRSDGRGDGARLHRGQQNQGLFIQTATATARVSTGGHKNRDSSFRRPRRRRAPPPVATKAGTLHSHGHSDSARLHWGPQKQGLFIQTATATARASTGGHKSRDFSFTRPQRQRASPPVATKAGTFHSHGHSDSARLHRGQQKHRLFTETATATARVSTNHLPPRC